MALQKYTKGSRVKALIGHPVWALSGESVVTLDICPHLKNDTATVEYTYGEMSEIDNKFSKGEDGYKLYSLNFDKYGSISWFDEENLIPAV